MASAPLSETKGTGASSWSFNEPSPGGKEGASSTIGESIRARPLGIAFLKDVSALAVMPDSKDCISHKRGIWRKSSEDFGGVGESKETLEPNGLKGPIC